MWTLESASHDFDIEPDQTLLLLYEEDKFVLTKYYGLVPRHLLEQAQQETDAEEETVSLTGDEEDTSLLR